MSEQVAVADARSSDPLVQLREVVAAVISPGEYDSKWDRALDVLNILAHKEGIPIAIVGGLAAIWHGYKRYTHDVDMVVSRQHLDTLIRIAPRYGIKVIWHDPQGWHKFSWEGVRIEVVPEGETKKDAPTLIPGPQQLGVQQGADYANLEGWIETKLGSNRQQDRADIVQVLKKSDPAASVRIRAHLAGVHTSYLRLFDELAAAAEQELEQEKERGGLRD